MDIPYQFLRVGILLNNDGVVAVLKQGSMPVMTPVVAAGVRRFHSIFGFMRQNEKEGWQASKYLQLSLFPCTKSLSHQ